MNQPKIKPLAATPAAGRAFLVGLALFFLAFPVLAQPANDQCQNAIALSVNSTCQLTSGTTVDANGTIGLSSGNCGDDSNQDVWYRFTPLTNFDTVQITATTGVGQEGRISVAAYLAANGCTGMNYISCVSSAGAGQVAKLWGFTQSTAVRLRVYHWLSFATGPFTICVKRGNPPPANDNCLASVALTVQPNCISTSGSTSGATASGASLIPCSGVGTSADDDVWYRFTPLTFSDTIRVTGTNGFNPVVQLFSGSCGNLSGLSCSNGTGVNGIEKVSTSNMVQGQTYYARVFGVGNGQANTGTFSICAKAGATYFPPGNNDCSNATTLPVNNTCSFTNGSTLGASNGGLPGSGCSGSVDHADDDVWYRFTNLSAGDTVEVRGQGSFDPVVELWTGTCANGNLVACQNQTPAGGTERMRFPVGAANQTCYIRIYSRGSLPANRGNFTICVKRGNVPYPPFNDNIQGAARNISTGSSYTTISATPSPQDPIGPEFPDDDVWFSFTDPYIGFLSPDTAVFSPSSPSLDLVVEVFLGQRNNLNPVGFYDNGGPGVAEKPLIRRQFASYTNYTPGAPAVRDTLYYRVFSKKQGDSFSGNFIFSIKNFSNSASNPCASFNFLPSCTTSISTQNAISDGIPAICGGIPDDVVWLRYTQISPRDTIIVTPVGLNPFNPVLEIYEGDCFNLSPIACSNSGGAYQPEKIVIPNGEIRRTYFVRVFGFGLIRGSFTICQKVATGPSLVTNDIPEGATLLPISQTCNPISGTTIGANRRSNFSVNTVDAEDDVWYYVESESPTDSIIVQGQGQFDPVVEVGVPVGESFYTRYNTVDETGKGSTERLSLRSFPVKNCWIRVYGRGMLDSDRGNFTICFKRGPRCLNDSCPAAEAIPLGLEPVQLVRSGIGSTPDNPNQTGQICVGSNLAPLLRTDVWFTFTASTPTMVLNVQNSSYHSLVASLFKGNACNALTQVLCADSPFLLNPAIWTNTINRQITNLVVGDRYYLRLSEISREARIRLLPVSLTGSSPNDNCTQASVLTVPAMAQGFTQNATASSPANSCNNLIGTADDDLWYRVVPSTRFTRIKLIPGSSTFDGVLEIFSGDCNTPVLATCRNAGTGGVEEELVFESSGPFFIKVYSFGSIPTSRGSFYVTVDSMSRNQPSNDEFRTPVSITRSVLYNPLAFSTLEATQSFPPSRCNDLLFNEAQDVWFSQNDVISFSSNDSIIVQGLNGFDPVIEVMTRAEANTSSLNFRPNLVLCSNRSNSEREVLVYENSGDPLLIGDTYLFRVYGANGTRGNFTVAIKRSVNPGPQFNNEIYNAYLIDPEKLPGSLDGYTMQGSQQIPSTFGFQTGTEDVWYQIGQPSALKAAGARIRVEPLSPDFDPVLEYVELKFNYKARSVRLVNEKGLDEPEVAPNLGQFGINSMFRVYDARGGNGIKRNFRLVLTSGASEGNDTCTKARYLVANSDCRRLRGSLFKTKIRSNLYPCGGNTAPTLRSVWYRFRTNDPAVRLRLFCSTDMDGSISLFKGSCENLQFIRCQNSRGTGEDETLNLVSLDPSESYFVRISGANLDSLSDFEICLSKIDCEITNVTATASPLQTAVGGKIKVDMQNFQKTGYWEYSVNQGQTWVKTGSTAPSDTLDVTPAMVGNLWLRGATDDDSCRTGFSNILEIKVSCGTPFANPTVSASGGYIESVNLNNRLTISGADSLGGSYQNFTGDTLKICKISPIPIRIFPKDTSVVSGKAIWIDANRDGDFSDANESLLSLPPSSGNYSGSLNLANAPLLGKYTLRVGLVKGQQPSQNGCLTSPAYPSGEYEDYSIQIFAQPPASAGTDVTICLDSYTLNGSISPPGTTGTWQAIGTTATISNPGLPNASLSNLQAGLNIFRWSVSNGICPPGSDDVFLTRVMPPSTAVILNSAPSICTNVLTLQATPPTVGTGTWSRTIGTGTIQSPGSPVTEVTTLSSGNNGFRYTVANSPCQASVANYNFTTSANLPQSNAGPDQAVCQATGTLGGNNPGVGVTGLWTVLEGSATFLNPSSFSSPFTGLGIGTNRFRWTLSRPGCLPAMDEVLVIRQQADTARAGANQSTCMSTVTLNAQNASGNGAWSVVTGTGIFSNPTSAQTQVSGLTSGENRFKWTLNIPGCSSTQDTVSVLVSPNPFAISAGPDKQICAATSDSVAGTLPAGASGQWSVVQGTAQVQNATSAKSQVSNLSPGLNVLTWTVTAPGCSPVSATVTLTVVSPPSVAAAGADRSVCSNSAQIQAQVPLNGIGTWTALSPGLVFGNANQSQTSVNQLAPGPNTLIWTVSSGPCPASRDTLILNRIAGANLTANAGPDRTVCGSTHTLAATLPVSGVGKWEVITGGGTFSNLQNPSAILTNLPIGSNVFAWKVSLDTCSVSDFVRITREFTPLSLGPDTLGCTGTTLLIQPVNAQNYGQFLWSTMALTSAIQVTQSGLYSLRATTANGCSYRDTIRVIMAPCTEVGDLDVVPPRSLHVFPNPSSGKLYVRLVAEKARRVEVRLYAANGSLVQSRSEDRPEGDPGFDLDLSQLANGIYQLEVREETQVFRKRVSLLK